MPRGGLLLGTRLLGSACLGPGVASRLRPPEGAHRPTLSPPLMVFPGRLTEAGRRVAERAPGEERKVHSSLVRLSSRSTTEVLARRWPSGPAESSSSPNSTVLGARTECSALLPACRFPTLSPVWPEQRSSHVPPVVSNRPKSPMRDA